MKRLNRRRQKGVVAIETALGLLAFLMMIFYWIEVSYMGFVSSLMDYASAEASRGARTSSVDDYELDDYKDKFEAILKQESDSSIWFSFLDTSEFIIDVHYYKNVVDMACNLEETEAPPYCQFTLDIQEAPIAIYKVSYPYQPMFVSLFFEEGKEMWISREVIAIQEYERDQFNG